MNEELKMKNAVEWKREYFSRLVAFSVAILRFSDILRTNRTQAPVADQLIRSATSIGANVHEAQGAGSKKDFAHFLQIALKSGRETIYWLSVLEAYKGQSSTKIKFLQTKCEEIVSILYASLRKIRVPKP
jgi:four helix bundle protein